MSLFFKFIGTPQGLGPMPEFFMLNGMVAAESYRRLLDYEFDQIFVRHGTPIFVFTNMLVWNATKLISVRLHRWDIEPFHEQIKQFLGAESSQLRTENGVRKHLTPVFVVNSLLKSMDLSSPIGDLSMEWEDNEVPTFGQRCRRVILEVFYDIITQVHQWITTQTRTVPEIFQTLFHRLLRI